MLRRLLAAVVLAALLAGLWAAVASAGSPSPQVICISNDSSVETPEGRYARHPASCNFHAKGQPAAFAYMVQMRHIHWTSWGAKTAVGSGRELVNMVGEVPAKVRLSHPRSVCGHRVFTQAQFKGKVGGFSPPMQLDRRLASTACG